MIYILHVIQLTPHWGFSMAYIKYYANVENPRLSAEC
jgi:hypothetical protein